MGILVGILLLNSILMAIIIFLLNNRINKITTTLTDLSIDILIYDNLKEQKQREQKDKDKKAVNKVGNWKK